MADTTNIRNRVVEYLNTATFLTSEKEKIETLCKVQELVIHCDRTLLDSFLEDIVVFQNDRNSDVRKFVVGFIEEACKNDYGVIPRLVPNICLQLQDQAMAVVKRVVQSMGQILKSTLTWLSSSRTTTKEMEQAWEIVCSMKNKILKLIDHENDGVRTQAIKFLESLILVQTYTEPDSVHRSGEFSLDQIPLTLKVAKPRKLEEEAKLVLKKLIEFQGSIHISSVNLMTCMSTFSIIARARPQFMGQIIEALEILHANLPPTLTKSQVNSVRKHLKIQLLSVLRHSGSFEYQENMVAILNDLNVSSSEIHKAMPSKEDLRKRVKRSKLGEKSSSEVPTKKPRMDMSEVMHQAKPDQADDSKQTEESPIDITQKWVSERLSIDAVSNLVMVSMLNLPDALPSVFAATYKPVSSAGSSDQMQHLSRLIASQLMAAGVGPGAELRKRNDKDLEKLDDQEVESNLKSGRVIHRLVSKSVFDYPKTVYETPLMPVAVVGRPTLHKAKFVKLTEVTKPLNKPQCFNLQMLLLKNLLKAPPAHLDGVSHKNRHKIIAKLSGFATYEELVELESFIFEDMSGNADLLISWMYSAYANTQKFDLTQTALENESKVFAKKEFKNYDSFVAHILAKLISNLPTKERDGLISRFLLDLPRLNDSTLEMLWPLMSQGPAVVANMMDLFKDLCFLRPVASVSSASFLCKAVTHSDAEVRKLIEPVILELISVKGLEDIVIESAQSQLGFLADSAPPKSLFAAHLGRPLLADSWTEDAVVACLYLTLVILPKVQDHIHFLAQVYVKTVNEAKRTILRYLEAPVTHMGMDSSTLLSLVETCPKGSETLVTRIIHILTEKAPPSEELVERVKELYNKRVSDVRFLIPVLTGLTKREIVAVLPKLIKLNPQVVKEVFNRLWGVTLDKGKSPLSPVDLLVALHLIPPEKCDMKSIIKATAMCFAERSIYSAEVLAVVLQQLIEEPTLPTLFMRTVLQTLTHHPKLLSFVMSILQRLIGKQIWKQSKAWEGFIKCCQRAMPQSFLVLLQLPHTQLARALVEAPDMQAKLVSHVKELTDSQKSHIPSALLEVIENPENFSERET